MKDRGIGLGALVGVLLTLSLMGIMFLAEQVAGLPFAPFDLFDWMARILPGDIITLGIDIIVSFISGLNLGETSSTAKAIEQLSALVLFVLLGTLAGAVFFAVLRTRSMHLSSRAGLILGLGAGGIMLLISNSVGFVFSMAPLFSVVWVLMAFLAWGAAMGWAYNHLTLPQVSRSDAAAKGGESAPVETSIAVEPIDRRRFLIQLGSATAVLTVAGAGLGGIIGGSRRAGVTVTPVSELTPPDTGPGGNLPDADASVVPAPGTRPELTPIADHYRIDINLRPPEVEEEGWVLPITGLVNNPLVLTFDDIRNNYEAMDQYVTLSCISNQVGGDLIGTTLWTGVSLQTILDEVGLQEDAAYLKITAADGFHETVSIDLVQSDGRVMLCYAWDHEPLPVDHGFPLRIYIPDRYGMKQPRWITGIEVVADYEEGYWVRRGWDEVARMKTTSVIDAVASQALIEDDGQLLIPIGGIAHAGARGITRVEVQVDNGEWIEAQLRTPLSDTTWVIWRYDWPFAEGAHTFTVRATDGDTVLQDDTSLPPRPSGAQGYHNLRATLVIPNE